MRLRPYARNSLCSVANNITELCSLRQQLAWVNNKIYKGNVALERDKLTLQERITVLESETWSVDSKHMNHGSLRKENLMQHFYIWKICVWTAKRFRLFTISMV